MAIDHMLFITQNPGPCFLDNEIVKILNSKMQIKSDSNSHALVLKEETYTHRLIFQQNIHC